MDQRKTLNECKPIVTDPGYYIHPDGRVFKLSEISGCYDNGRGYDYVKLSGGRSNHAVHRLVASHFCERGEGHSTVDHIDGDKKNNHYTNLQWMSHGDNVRKHFSEGYTFVHEDGREEFTNTLREFARKHDLDHSALAKVVKGQRLKSTGGWRLKK